MEVGQMRGIWERVRRDDGMTIVEIMAAAVIMFIILTGVLGLVGRTTMMGAQAKEKNIMTNALNAYIESVHALPFEDVALVPDGELAPETVEVSNGYTITIHPTVLPVTGNDALKTLVVDITVEDGRGGVTSSSTEVTIRDREQFLTTPSDALAPTITWGSLMPPDRSVAWDTSWAPLGLEPEQYSTAAQPFYIDVEAAASEGRTIASVQVSYGFPCENPSGEEAVWAPAAQTWSSTLELFMWDTNEIETVYPEVGTPYDVRQVQDGWRTLKATVTDNGTPAASDDVVRYYLVDNFAPPAPASVVASAESATSASISWPKVMDGSHGAEGYDIRLLRQGSEDTDALVTPADAWADAGLYSWSDASGYDGETMSRAMGTEPFSRYAAQVRAKSPRFRSGWSEMVFVSRPSLTGTYDVERTDGKGNKVSWAVQAYLSVTAPQFPVSGDVTYHFYEVEDGIATEIEVGQSPLCEVTVPARSYFVEIMFTPDGYDGGTAQTVISNTVSTASNPSGTYPFAEGTW
jgi:type II secretory pathway pseudopilin PulG